MLLFSLSTHFDWDYPFGFLTTNSAGLFRDFPPSPHVCKSFPIRFSNPPISFSLAEGGRCLFVLPTPFSPRSEDTSSVVSGVLLRLLSPFLHPDVAVANRSRLIPSRMAWSNSLGTSTSAIWKSIFREWRTTSAPILISFSRNVINVQ